MEGSFPPGRPGAVIVVGIDAALAAFAPAVELPEVEVVRTEMVDDDVEDDGDTLGMRGVDELLEAVRAAIGALDSERIGEPVSPRGFAGKGHERHELQRVDAEIFQVGEPGDNL